MNIEDDNMVMCFYGKPVTGMTREELLNMINFMAKENKALREQKHKLEMDSVSRAN